MAIQKKEDYEKLLVEYYEGYKNFKKVSLEMAEELDMKGEKIKEYLSDCENKRYVDVVAGFSVKLVEPEKVVWDIEKFARNAPSDVYRKVVKKKIAVKNEMGLTELLKRHGVDMKSFWECVELEREMDEKALLQMLELGEIEKDVLDGTFELVTKKPYIRVCDTKK